MAEFPSLPIYTDALIADTSHLTNEEFGAYTRLLIFAWRTRDCALPDDDKRLRTMLGLTPKKWASLRPAVQQFFDVENGQWTQRRLTKTRLKVSNSVEQKRKAGAASAAAKGMKRNNGRATAVPTGAQRGAQQNANNPKPNISKDMARDARGGQNFIDLGEAGQVSEKEIEAIKDGKRYLVGGMSAAKARALVEGDLVTAEQCRKVGLL